MEHAALAVAIFQSLLNGIGWLLSRVYDVIPNYGLTIVGFTLAIRVVLLPLNIKQVRSMQAQQALQPKIKEIQRKFRGDRMRMTEEVNKLYKEHGANPLGGCFPLIAQLPVLFALYAVLRVPSGVEHVPVNSNLRSAIIHQESGVRLLGANLLCSTRQAGTTVKFPPSKPPLPIKELQCGAKGADRATFYGLVLLMIGTTYYQQRQMLKASPGGATQQQQMLTYMMPALFGVFGFTFPSGLVLYWTTTNFIQIGIQHFVRREKGDVPPAKPAKEAPKPKAGPSGDGARRVRRLEGRPPSQQRRRPQGSSKRSGNAGSRKKRPNR